MIKTLLKFLKILLFTIIFGGIVTCLELSGYVYHNDILAKMLGFKVQGYISPSRKSKLDKS